MATVVTKAGHFACPDQGTQTLTSSAKLTVSGQAVVLYSTVPTLTGYPGCTFQVSGSAKPCTKTTPVAQGQAAKLTAGSQPVLLDNLQAGTDNAPAPGAVTVTAGQTKLTAT